MWRWVTKTGIASRQRMSLANRARARSRPSRGRRFVGPIWLVGVLAVASIVLAWIFTAHGRFEFALPSDPVVARFVDAHFSHEERVAPSAKSGVRNISKFILTVELTNNTNHQITADSADFYDKSGYFLFGCRIVSKPRTVARNSAGKLRCFARGRLPRARVDLLLRKICEVDLNLTGRGLAVRAHPVPWPRSEGCVS